MTLPRRLALSRVVRIMAFEEPFHEQNIGEFLAFIFSPSAHLPLAHKAVDIRKVLGLHGPVLIFSVFHPIDQFRPVFVVGIFIDQVKIYCPPLPIFLPFV